MNLHDLQRELVLGTILRGKVIKHMPFGVFLELDYPFLGLIQITDFKDEGKMDTSEYPQIGEWIEAVVLGFTDDNRKQIWLSLKPSQMSKAKEQKEG